ncbi:MAG: hypothetical protein GYB31_05470 [Bacteroidetes bacterium]|nr:hypothetical protein [Bacteroidota bacterium]
MMMSRLLTGILVIGLAIGCGSSKSGKGYKYSADDVIEMSKGACFGTCPVYEFRIDGLGNATFKGQAFVKKEGDFTKKFSAKETNEIFDEYKTSDFWSLEEEYTAAVSDLPTTWVSFYFMDKSKKVRAYYDFPVRLKLLIDKTHILASSEDGWKDEGAPDK